MIIGVTGKNEEKWLSKEFFLYLNNKRISLQIAFISAILCTEHSEQHCKDILKILQNFVIAEIKWQHTSAHKVIAITLCLRDSDYKSIML